MEHTDPPRSSPKTSKTEAIELAKATAHTLLKAVVEFSDAFPPLKTVATAIQFIVECAEKAGNNREAMEKLLRRIKKVAELSVESDDDTECKRRESLTRDLESISSTLEPLRKQNKLKAFLKSSADEAVVQEYITKVEQALFDYQFALIQDLHRLNIEQISYDERNTLDKLSRAKDASFNASDDRPRCLEGTRVEILRTLQSWAEAPDAKQIYWLSGHAGSGKSTISQSFAEQLFLDRKLGASFFCSRESTQRSDLKMIFPTVAFQLAMANHPDSPKYRKTLLRTLASNPDVASLSLHNQLEELIVGPVKQSSMKTIVLIDALDECKDSKSISTILDILARSIAQIPSLQFFITSRPEPHIRSAFRLPQLKSITETITLHEVNVTSANEDIRLYLEKSLGSLAVHRSDLDVSHPWPTEEELDRLTEKSAGLFVFASTAVKFIDSAGDDPRERLQEIIKQVGDTDTDQSSSNVYGHVNPYEDLDALYLNILKGASSGANIPRLRSIMGLLVVACDMLSLGTIAGLLGLGPTTVKTYLRTLHSILLVPAEPAGLIRFHHTSLHGFITDPARCTDTKYLLNADDEHLRIAQRCLELMKRELKKNMCDLPRYSMNDVLEPAVRDERITEPIKYCCRHWARHMLSDGQRDKHLRALESSLEYFLTTQQLMWIEVLSLLRELRRAVESLSRMREWLTSLGGHCVNLLHWVIDGQRFILASFDVIEISVAHIYHSALVFTPEQSLLKKSHAQALASEPKAILGVPPTWAGPLGTIRVPDMVAALEYSHNGKIIAAGVDHIRCYCHLFWSATGERFADLDGGGDGVQALSFSHDDKILATVTLRDITLWNVESSTMISTLAAPSRIDSVSFHPSPQHGSLLLSSCRDGQVLVWDAKSGTVSSVFTVPDSSGEACWLSGNEQTVLIGTTSGRISLWAVDPPYEIRTLAPHETVISSPITTITSSRDGLLVASGSDEGLLVIYDPRSGAALQSFELHTTKYNRSPFLAFSVSSTCTCSRIGEEGTADYSQPKWPSPRGLASSYEHSSSLSSIALSPDGRFLISGTYGSTVYIWEVSIESHKHDDVCRHLQYMVSAHFSSDEKLLLSGAEDQTVRTWDTVSGALLKTFHGHSAAVQDAIFLRDQTLVASIDQQGQVILWDYRQDNTSSKLCETRLTPPRPFDSLAPFTHDTVGFFYFSRDESPGSLECWVVDAASKDELRLVLTGRGRLPRHDDVRRVYHDTCGPDISAVKVVLLYKSGQRFSAVWKNHTLRDIPTAPDTLEFIEEVNDCFSVAQGIITGSVGEPPFVGSEEPCQLDETMQWVSDKQGRLLLWLPALRNCYHRWCGRRLLLQGPGTAGGQLTLLNFEGAEIDSDNLF